MQGMSVKTFLDVAKYINPTKTSRGLKRPTAIMLRGPHGIGKSAIAGMLARDVYKLPLIDRRIGQMTEGDLIGLGKVDGEVTRFLPVDFIRAACDKPHVLFFDEMNRGTREVMQVMFQIVLDYELNGNVLHPETRVIVALNDGAEYQVTKMDPALKDRFFIVDLEPTVDDWLKWAADEGNVDQLIIDFIRTRPMWLEARDQPDPRKRYPSRRSWEAFSRAAGQLFAEEGFDPSADPWGPILFNLGSGFVGVEAASDFKSFVTENLVRLTAEVILSDHEKTRAIISKMKGDRWAIASDLLVAYTKNNELTPPQAKNWALLFKMLPQEHKVRIWSETATQNTGQDINVKNLLSMHEDIRDELVAAIMGQAQKDEKAA